MHGDPTKVVAANGRRFATFAAAVLVLVVDPATDRFLLFEAPGKRGRPGWEVVNGAVERDETLLEAVHREVLEEAGAIRVEVLGPVHAESWRYDVQVPNMISVAFAAVLRSGDVSPGDDVAGCAHRWASLDDVRALLAAGEAAIPGDVAPFERALDEVRRWTRPPVPVSS